MTRWRGPLLWLAPIFACLAVYYPGLQCWFRMDDFAWLGLRLSIANGDDLLAALFQVFGHDLGHGAPLSAKAKERSLLL